MSQQHMYLICAGQHQAAAESLVKKLSERGGPGAIILLTQQEAKLAKSMTVVPIGDEPESGRDAAGWVALIKQLIVLYDYANDDSNQLISRINDIADSYFDGSSEPPTFCPHGRRVSEYCEPCGRVNGGR
jgi:hypothetical protein